MNNGISAEAIDLIKKMRLGYMATFQADGKVCLLHKGTLTVLDDHHLIFSDIASSDTIEILKRCPQVVVEVVDPFSKTGFRFKGKAKCEVNRFILILVESYEPTSQTYAMAKERTVKPWATLFNNLWKF